MKLTGALLAIAVLVVSSCTSPPETPTIPPPPATVETAPEPTPTVAPTPEPTAQVQKVEEEAIHRYDDYYGAAVASLEERIFLSDVIVRATLLSASGGTLRFRAIEYLKGTGARELEIHVPTKGRDTTWDGQEAVLFLATSTGRSGGTTRASGSTSTFEFADTTTFDYRPEFRRNATSYAGNLPEGHTIDSRNPVWQPLLESPGSGSSARTTAGGASSEVSLTDLREKISWIEGGDGIDGYDDCIRRAVSHMRWGRDWEAYHGSRYLPQSEEQIESGLPAETVVHDYNNERQPFPGYGRVWTSGQDAELFSEQIVDDDDDPTNGFGYAFTTNRPLPGGTYRVIGHGQLYHFDPCNFTAEHNRIEWVVTVTVPEGTLAEALFDPVTDGAAVSATTTVGAIGWESGEVEATLNQAVTNHFLDFIALDGTVSLSLEVASATSTAGTLSWSVASQPWNDGDQLMVRIRRAGAPSPASP